MKKFTAEDPESKSADVIADNISQLKAIFPEALTEGQIDFEVLKQLLGGAVDEREEKFGLNWHGKRAARRLALTPSLGTLRPCPEESVDWDTTQNLFIEGDNLEVLKLLQKSYANKVKLIYIDPPYNTGKDFVYPDNFRDSIKNYLELTDQTDDAGRKISTNSETSGRYHTDWLNMMYPRLKLARNLLREDGVIFISIDDNEVANLRKLCDDIFGEENFLATLVWQNKKGGGNDAKYCAVEHEYIIALARSKEAIPELLEEYSVAYAQRYKESDRLGRFYWDTFRRKSGKQYYSITCPDGTIISTDSSGNPASWLRSEDRFRRDLAAGEVKFERLSGGWSVMFKQRMPSGKRPRSLITNQGANADGSAEAIRLFGVGVFPHPKPAGLVRHLCGIVLGDCDKVLDFFAGSATTAHAVLDLNKQDGGNREFILVQLPEPCDKDSEAYKAGLKNIAEIGKERIRRVIKEIKAEQAQNAKQGALPGMGQKPQALDLGFKVFKLDSSNIQAWNPRPDDLAKTLVEATEHLKANRTEQDILYELLLKLGLDLTVPIENKTIFDKTVYSIGAGALMACLAKEIAANDIEPLALGMVEWHKTLAPAGGTRVVFRDSAFEGDVAKTNLTAIFQQNGLKNVRSL